MISRIGKYTVEAELGRGGFGRVYRSFDPDVKRQVAIKVLTAESDPELLRRFQLEVGTTGNLRHKNIVTLYESGDESGVPYLVMELLEGQSLEAAIKGRVPLTILDKVRIMTQVADGLSYAHNQGVIHRDVKPANIMLLRDGSVKIMDFGIARVANTSTMVTREGFIVGTVPYMAPELFEPGGKADEETDVFSYGTVYYELLTGTHPFSVESDIYGTIRRIQAVEPDAVGRVVPECPEALELLVHRAMAKDREIRYQDFGELLLDSEGILSDLQRERAAEILAEVKPLLDAGDLETAENKLLQVVELDPGNREARQLRNHIREQNRRGGIGKRISTLLAESEAQLRQRQFGEAVQTLENALRLNKNDETIQSRLSEANARLRANLQANKLVAEARRDQQRGQLPEALERLKVALQLDPDHADARTLAYRVETELERRAREQAVQDAMNRATESLAQRRYDDALAALERVEADPTSAVRVSELRAHIEREKEDAERRQRADRFNMAVGRLRETLQQRDHERAAQMLQLIASRFGAEPGAADLLSQLRAQMEAQVREDEIARYSQQARELVRQKSFREALDLLAEALGRYPRESGLERLRESAESLYAAQQRSEGIAAVVEEANALRRRRNPREALEVIAQGRRRWGDDAALRDLALETQIEIEEQRYAAGLRDLLRSAGELSAAGKYDEAVAAIEGARAYKDEAAVRTLLASAKAAAAVREEKLTVDSAMETARSLEAQGSAPQALAALDEALRKLPRQPDLSRAANELRDRIAEAQRIATVSSHRAAIERAIKERNWKKAETEVRQAQHEVPGEALFDRFAEEVKRLEEEAAKAAAYDAALRQAEELKNRGELEKAEERLGNLVGEANDERATRLLQVVRDQRFSEKLQEADRAVGRGDFETGLFLMQTMRSAAPPEWTVKIEAAYQEAKVKKDRESARRREAEIATIAAAIRERLQRDDVSQAAAQLASGKAKFSGESVWEVLEGELAARRSFLESFERAEQERKRGNLDAAEQLLAKLKTTGEDTERVRSAREAIISERAARQRAEALEEARREQERLERERAQRAEAARVEQEQAKRAEVERLEKERIEQERAEQAQRERAQQAEAERLEKERVERERAEQAQRKRTQKAEAERLEKERIERERAEQAQHERAQKAEAERLEKERIEQERAEQAERERAKRAEAERLEKERIEQERAEQAQRGRAQKAEAERLEKERIERERAEQAERVRAKRAEAERLEKERVEQERAEQAERERAKRQEAERLEKERIERARAQQAETERLEQAQRERAQKAEAARLEKERLDRDRAEQAQRERAQRAEAERERIAREAATAELVRQQGLEAAPKKPLPTKLIAAGIAAVLALTAGIIVLPRFFHTTITTPPKPPETLVPFEIHTDPRGAAVKLGDQSCVTPNCSFKLPPGDYHVSARLQGYIDLDRSVTIHPGDQPLDLILQPVPVELPKPGAATGTLIVKTGIPDAQVVVDKAPRGRTDASGNFSLPLEVKPHDVSVEKTGYQASPRQQRVRIADGASQTVTFRLEMENATLELRGAPAGADISINGVPLGKTNGSTFTAPVKPGNQVLQVTLGSATQRTPEKFEPGQRLPLDWPNVAPPVVKAEPKPTLEALEAKAWDGVRSSTNPADLEKFLADYPNGAHKDQAQSKLDDLVWSRTNRNDAQSLQAYRDRFPQGSHMREDASLLAENAWNTADRKDPKALRAFIDLHPGNPHNSEAQTILDQLEKERLAQEQRLREQQRQQQEPARPEPGRPEPAQQDGGSQAKAVQAVLDQFNSAFANHDAKALRIVWPQAPNDYTRNMTGDKYNSITMSLVAAGPPTISGDTASLPCNLTLNSIIRGQAKPPSTAAHTVDMRKQNGRWIINGIR